MKRIIVMCDLGVGGERGRVLFGGGYSDSSNSHGIQRSDESD